MNRVHGIGYPNFVLKGKQPASIDPPVPLEVGTAVTDSLNTNTSSAGETAIGVSAAGAVINNKLKQNGNGPGTVDPFGNTTVPGAVQNPGAPVILPNQGGILI